MSNSHQHHHRPSPFPSCFRPSSAAADHRPSTTTTSPNLTTCLYTTEHGLFALSWSRSALFGRSLHLHHHNHHHHHFSDEASFHLHIKPFPWSYATRRGSKKLNLPATSTNSRIFWDLSGSKFGSGPEPVSGFYIAVVVDGAIVLLVGDIDPKEVYTKTKQKLNLQNSPMVLRREHVYGTKLYSTKAVISGSERTISIECKLGSDPKLCFTIDGKRALQIKHLKWKFRGNDSIEIDGTYVQISWDVYNWLFDKQNQEQDRYALFMFSIYNQKTELSDEYHNNNSNSSLSMWSHSHSQHQNQHQSFGFEFEEKKMKRKKSGAGLLMRSGRSSSSSSLSSAISSGSCNSSVMEWANSEDDEFMSLPYSGFSLLVYAWK